MSAEPGASPDPLLGPLLDRLAVRDRVRLVLVCAERCLARLSDRSRVRDGVEAAVRLAFAWAAGQAVPIRDLYDHIHHLLALEPLVGDEAERADLFAVISALYYLTWQANRAQPADPPLPNDMAEAGEDDVADCLRYARQAVPDPEAEYRWQLETVARYLASAV